ncbi:MAG: nitronate monooxygenase [Clostridia bacterium]|nr:nitronate monooxygenase [Clostridia bacterium]
MKTSVTEVLGIEYPVICGAMAAVSSPKLAAAVSEAGGLGVLASGTLTPDELRRQIDETKALTKKPFAVNLLMRSDNADEMTDIIIEKGVKIVMSGAGSPERFMEKFKANGIKVVPVIPNVKTAKKMEALGVDAIVAEGMESGGFIGETTTLPLIPQVCDAVKIPVIAAGGIADGRAMAAAFILGARGIQMGTRFLASEECEIHDNCKSAVVGANDTATVIMGRAIRHGVRGLRTEASEKLLEAEKNGDGKMFHNLLITTVGNAVRGGDMTDGSLMCGQIAGVIHDVKPARDIIKGICDDAENILKNFKL